jgi:hypothetical protein
MTDRSAGIKRLQEALNEQGAKLTVDGDYGPKTEAVTLDAIGIMAEPGQGKSEETVQMPSGSFLGAPWVFANIDLLGRHETDPELNARYVPEWAKEGLPGYKTLSGNSFAWCSVRENADKRKVGVKGTNSAGAASWSKWGKQCPFWFGATLDIKHASGGRHVGNFLYWIDEKRRTAAVYGGNQGNRLSIASTTLAPGHDTLVTGPRWPTDFPDGRVYTMAEVLKLYPYLKVGGSMGSTT